LVQLIAAIPPSGGIIAQARPRLQSLIPCATGAVASWLADSPRVKSFANRIVLLTPLAVPAIPARLERKGDDVAVKTLEKPDTETGGIAADRLRSLVERIERLEEERKALGNDIKDIYAEAKSAGFDVKVLRQLIRIRKQESAEVEEQETLLDLYRRALGM
jgi:uncharacterized protein (UPF0335 family)